MSTLHFSSSPFAMILVWIVQAVALGTLFAIITAATLRLLGRRMRPAAHGAFWLVVLLKFILPVGPAWSLSFATIFHRVADRMTPQNPAALAHSSDESTPRVIILESPAAHAARAKSPPPVLFTANRVFAALVALYACSVLIIAARRLMAYRAFARACRALPQADPQTAALTTAICSRMNLRSAPDVRISDEAPAPFVLGFFHPTLVLSRRQLVRPDELEAVILHEVAHLRRGDLIVRYVQWFAGTWLFFWPVVAWVNRRIDLAREAACDEWALRHGRLAPAEYARCLLRALHPAPARLTGYCPASMAANLQTVERRIEMILDPSNVRRGTSRFNRGALGLPAIAVLAAWSSFVLAGAAPVEDTKKDTTDAKTETKVETKDGKTVVVVKASACDDKNVDTDKMLEEALKNLDPAVRDHIKAAMAKGGASAGAFGHAIILKRSGKGEPNVAFAMINPGMSQKQLADFLAAHPTADANGDGKLTSSEHDAYLVALALSDPSAVLGQFPKADRNNDGTLDEKEAARLVSGCDMTDCLKSIKVNGIAPQAGQFGDKTNVQVRVLRRSVVQVGGKPHDIGGFLSKTSPAADWITEHINAQPTAAEVARYVKLVEEAPRAAFLEAHPDADANHDGKLTDQEQMDYLHQQAMRSVLEAHPEYDLNGDGVLSPDEFAKAGGNPGQVNVMKIQKSVTGPDGQTKTDEKTVILSGEDGEEQNITIDTDDQEDFQP